MLRVRVQGIRMWNCIDGFVTMRISAAVDEYVVFEIPLMYRPTTCEVNLMP